MHPVVGRVFIEVGLPGTGRQLSFTSRSQMHSRQGKGRHEAHLYAPLSYARADGSRRETLAFNNRGVSSHEIYGRVMTRRTVSARSAWTFAALAFFTGLNAFGQGGVSTEGPFTVFRTGTNESLVTLSLPFGAPPTNSPSFLRFDFGFATDEPDVPDTFFDSFSVTLQPSDQSGTALLLTADRTGVQWAPPNPGGLWIDPTDVERASSSFPNLNPALALKFAYSISFALPPMLTGGPLYLFFDLFDNLNAAASMAYVQSVRIESSVPSALKLVSALAIGGPFAEEPAAVLDESTRTFTLSAHSTNSFFRIAGDRTTRIVGIHLVGGQVVVEYQLVHITLQTAATVNGPYSADTAAVLDEASRSLTLTNPGVNRFYRLVSETGSRLKPPSLVGNQLILGYEFDP